MASVRRHAALPLGAAVLSCVVAAALVGDVRGTVLISAVTGAGYGTAGALLARARPENLLGWLLLLVGALDGGTALLAAWAASPDAVGSGLRTPAAWLASWLWFPALALVPTVLLVLYPSGTAGGRARRALLASALVGMSCVAVALALSGSSVDDVVPGLANPLAVEPLSVTAAVAGFVLLLPSVVVSVADAVRRVRHAGSPEREQLLWMLLTVAALVVGSYTPWTGLRAVVQTFVPFAVAVGVVRHRLLDLQVVVRRTLMFSGMTAGVVVVFAGSTAVLSGAVDGGPLPVATAAALVAVGLTPAQQRLQRAVDRLVYGDRRDPVRAVATLGRQVAERAPDDLVREVLRTVAAALRSPCVVLADTDGMVQARTAPDADGGPLVLPLQVAARDVGRLHIFPRSPRDSWTRQDSELIAVLAQQVAIVAHAAALNAELARSRDGVLAATAEERRRLRAELHDGLGPTLSGIALGLEAAEVALERDLQRAQALLARLRSETQTAGREVRLLIDGLRPVALDGQGLAEALRAFVGGLVALAGDRVAVTLDVAEPLPPLGPDVEAAAYRIVTEAVTNVLRHSGASTCRVAVSAVDAALTLLIEDDGTGLPYQHRDGVGLASMRWRAAELGGTWEAQARPGGGTCVRVALPLRSTVVAP